MYQFQDELLTSDYQGPFLLTELLLPTLISTSSKSNGFKARVVNMTSGYHFLSKIDFNKLHDTPSRRKTSPQDLYAQSKLVRSNTNPLISADRESVHVDNVG